MKSFYDNFEGNVSGFAPDLRKYITTRVEDLLDNFDVSETDIKVELECRYKNVTSDKLVGPILADLDKLPGLVKSRSEITDLNHSIELDRKYMFTVRDSTVGETKTLYAKAKIRIPQNTPAWKFIDSLDSLGIRLSFSLEIESESFCRNLLNRVSSASTPLKRVKDRESYFDKRTGISFDITQVVQANNLRRETEVEADYTVPYRTFISEEPVGRIKSFISFVEERSRTLVYRSRTLLPKSLLENAIVQINTGLGIDNPRPWRIERKIPQVRNIQVQDLLYESYKGYAATPKADGYRHFMVIMTKHIVLVRPPNIYKVLYEGDDIPQQWVGFVFDGELVERNHWKVENLNAAFVKGVDNYYCIFDVLGFPADRNSFPDQDRRGVLQRINRLKTYFEEVRRQQQLGPLRWSANYNSIYFQPQPVTRITTQILKTFFEIKPYDDATQSPWFASDAFFDHLLPKLRYENDGLIFTPVNVSYPDLTENMSLKWKPLDLLSIDFRYRDGDLLVATTAEQQDDSGRTMMELPFRGTPLFPLSRDEIVIIDPEGVRPTSGFIYEFIFDTISRKFRVTRPRFDKSMPNTLRDASQIWTDYNSPVTDKLIRGIGRDGLVHCQREALWSWFENLISKAEGPVLDLTDIQPARDFPIRFLEDLSLQSLMKSVPVYRLVSPFPYDFPLASKLPDDPPQVDIVIISGQQMMLLENRENIFVGNPKIFTERYMDSLRVLVSSAKRVFIRNLPAIIPGQTPSLIHPERSACGNEEELVFDYMSDECLQIEFKLGGVFYDATTSSYDTLLKTHAYLRDIKNEGDQRVVSAGHRVSGPRLEDMGPERILSGKHFGRLFDYLYNVIVPSSYFSFHRTQAFERVDPEDSPLQGLLDQYNSLSLSPQDNPDPLDEMSQLTIDDTFRFNRSFGTVKDNVPETETMELVRESTMLPDAGNIFEIIAKAMMIIEMQTPPLNRVTYDYGLVSKRAAEMKLVLGNLSVEELTEAIYKRLNLGLVFVRRIYNSQRLTSYFSRFILPDRLNEPLYGFLIIEARLESRDLISSCSLLSYQKQWLIHHSDPILSVLYNQPLKEIRLKEETSKLSPTQTGAVKVGSTTWKSLHRLFSSMRFSYPGAPDANRKYLEEILKETTDNKADYLMNMQVPARFRNQPWGIQLLQKIEEYSALGVRPDPAFDERAENEFEKLLDGGATKKLHKELIETGDAFLFDENYAGNLYGKGLMNLRSRLRN